MIAVSRIVSSINEASICQEEDNMMPCISTLVRTLGVMTLVGMASLSLPFLQRAPVIVTGPPVVVAEPQVVYGYPAYRGPYRYWKHHHHHDD